MRGWQLKSESSQEKSQQPNVPELELSVVIGLLKERSIFLEQVPNKPYYVRFKELSTGRAVQGMTHSKGTKLSPRFTLQILERFGIAIPDFLEALATSKKVSKRAG